MIDAIITLKDQFSATLKNVNGNITEFSKQTNYMGKNINRVGKDLEKTGKGLTTTITMPIVGIGIASAKAGMDFEAAMSRVKAISGATGNDFKQLNDLALKLGADTSFSASQAAEGMENLASAGFNVKEIMDAMPGMLDLAASGGVQIAEASDIAASALRGFGLEASQSSHVADVLAKAAADTNAGISDMGVALKYAAPPAHALGLSLEEVSSAIGIMANSGIKADMAGTTIRGALTRLASPSKEASTMMKSIGFNAFDAHGKLLPLSQVIGNLQKSTKGLTDEQKQNAIATIFGQETMSGMLTLVQAGPDQLQKLSDGFKNSSGAAKEMAKTMQDNGKGSIEQMMGSLETAGIITSQVLAPSIKQIADNITSLANRFSQLNPRTQETIVRLALFAAAVGPVIWYLGIFTTGIGRTITGIGKLTREIQKAGGILAWLALPGHMVVIILVALVAAAVLVATHWNQLRQIFDNFIQVLQRHATAVTVVATILAAVFGPALVTAGARLAIMTARLVAQTAAWVAYNAIMLIVRGGLAIATAAQWLFNFALSANPIVAVIVVLTALVAMLIKLTGNWNAVTNAIEKAWNWLTTWNRTKAENKNATFTSNYVSTGSIATDWKAAIPGKNALGTSYWRGGETWVGENGPEKVWLPSGSKISDHRNSTSSIGNNIIISKLADTIIVREEADIDKIATAIASKIDEHAFNM